MAFNARNFVDCHKARHVPQRVECGQRKRKRWAGRRCQEMPMPVPGAAAAAAAVAYI